MIWLELLFALLPLLLKLLGWLKAAQPGSIAPRHAAVLADVAGLCAEIVAHSKRVEVQPSPPVDDAMGPPA